MIIGGSASQDLAAKVANELGEKLGYVESKKFPDGERYLRMIGNVEEEVTIIQSTGFPQDENLVELLFLIKNTKDLGAEKVRVVVPYMGYARQEKRFSDGEAISAEIVANLIELAGADEFITVNIHEESVLDFFNIKSSNLSAMAPIANYIGLFLEDKPVIFAPDYGAFSFAKEIASILNCSCSYLSKVRLGPDKVETKIVKEGNDNVSIDFVEGKDIIIIDDIISTGGTIVNAINILKDHGAKDIHVSCVHPILVNGATNRIYSAGAKKVFSTNSLSSDTSVVSLSKIIADALR